jgi:hypothetical protein
MAEEWGFYFVDMRILRKFGYWHVSAPGAGVFYE